MCGKPGKAAPIRRRTRTLNCSGSRVMIVTARLNATEAAMETTIRIAKRMSVSLAIVAMHAASCTSSTDRDAMAAPGMACETDADCADGGPGAVPNPLRFVGEEWVAISGTSDDDIWVLGHRARPRATSGFESLALICPVDRSADAFVRHFDGTSWTRMDGVSDTQLQDIWAHSPNDVWAVGPNGVVAHYDGSAWTQSDLREIADVDLTDACHELSLQAVWGSGPSDIWAVGYAYPSPAGPTLVLHYDGSKWTREPVTDTDGLFDVWGTAADDVWIVGSSGITHHFDGTEWSKIAAGTSLYRFGIWGAAAADVWAVGNGGSITRFDGTSWSLLHERPWQQFEAIWGASSKAVWAVGERTPQGMPAMPLAMYWDGETWSEQTATASEGLRDVWVSGSGQAWAISREDIVSLGP
jgi:hypothetical protein